jgi:hypothetical protein
VPTVQEPVEAIKEVKALLIHNGFRPAMTFYVASPRQLTFRAIQDRIQYYGVVVKTAPRQVLVKVQSTEASGASARLSLKFEA